MRAWYLSPVSGFFGLISIVMNDYIHIILVVRLYSILL